MSLRRKRAKFSSRIAKRNRNKSQTSNLYNATFLNKHQKNPLENLSKWIEGCYSEDPLKSIISIRKLLIVQSSDRPIKEVVDCGVIEQIMKLLRINNHKNDLLCCGYIRYLDLNDICIPMDIINMITKISMMYNFDDKLQNHGICILINIASDQSIYCKKYRKYLIDLGIIPLLTETFWLSSNIETKSNTIKALGNIAGDSPKYRDFVLKYDILYHIKKYIMDNIDNINIINEFNKSNLYHLLYQNIAWILSNLCRGHPSPKWKYIELILFILSNMMIKFQSHEILQYICWGFNYLSGGNCSDKQIENVINYGHGLLSLFKLLDNESDHVRYITLRTMGNIISSSSSNNEQYIDKLINMGILNKIKYILQKETSTFKREGCWTLSNITGSNKRKHIQCVIDENLVCDLKDILINESYEIAKEALWAIGNITINASNQQIKYLIDSDILLTLSCFIRDCVNIKNDEEILMVILEIIENILKNDNFNNNKYIQCIKEYDLLNIIQNENNQILSIQFKNKLKLIKNKYFNYNQQYDKYELFNLLTLKVPNKYICIQCKLIGIHWIMQCPQNKISKN